MAQAVLITVQRANRGVPNGIRHTRKDFIFAPAALIDRPARGSSLQVMGCVAHLEGSQGVARVLAVQLLVANLEHILGLLGGQKLLVLGLALLGDV